MQQKIYDKTLGKWITISSTNAEGIELTNPGFLNELGESVSVNNGMTKVDNRLTREIGRASCRERVWQYVEMSGGGGALINIRSIGHTR